jgi:type II secretory pathway predicted ATPase ExeA
MPCILIVGDTNAGKTMIANRFLQQHPASDNPDGDKIILPVLAIQAPPTPNEKLFYESILEKLNSPYQPHKTAAKGQFQVLRLLKQIGLKILIIDEIHNILSGPVTLQRQFLNVLRYFSNDLQIPLVGLGTKEALRAIQADHQLANRFHVFSLSTWQLNRDYLNLLASFEQILPLQRPSRLIERQLAQKLLSLSEGNLGELSALLVSAATYAVKSGAEQINEQVIDSLNWIPPSERRVRAERYV